MTDSRIFVFISSLRKFYQFTNSFGTCSEQAGNRYDRDIACLFIKPFRFRIITGAYGGVGLVDKLVILVFILLMSLYCLIIRIDFVVEVLGISHNDPGPDSKNSYKDTEIKCVSFCFLGFHTLVVFDKLVIAPYSTIRLTLFYNIAVFVVNIIYSYAYRINPEVFAAVALFLIY